MKAGVRRCSSAVVCHVVAREIQSSSSGGGQIAAPHVSVTAFYKMATTQLSKFNIFGYRLHLISVILYWGEAFVREECPDTDSSEGRLGGRPPQ